MEPLMDGEPLMGEEPLMDAPDEIVPDEAGGELPMDAPAPPDEDRPDVGEVEEEGVQPAGTDGFQDDFWREPSPDPYADATYASAQPNYLDLENKPERGLEEVAYRERL